MEFSFYISTLLWLTELFASAFPHPCPAENMALKAIWGLMLAWLVKTS